MTGAREGVNENEVGSAAETERVVVVKRRPKRKSDEDDTDLEVQGENHIDIAEDEIHALDHGHEVHDETKMKREIKTQIAPDEVTKAQDEITGDHEVEAAPTANLPPQSLTHDLEKLFPPNPKRSQVQTTQSQNPTAQIQPIKRSQISETQAVSRLRAIKLQPQLGNPSC